MRSRAGNASGISLSVPLYLLKERLIELLVTSESIEMRQQLQCVRGEIELTLELFRESNGSYGEIETAQKAPRNLSQTFF